MDMSNPKTLKQQRYQQLLKGVSAAQPKIHMPKANLNVKCYTTGFAREIAVHSLNVVYNNHNSQPKFAIERYFMN